jgi:hypothetical protein
VVTVLATQVEKSPRLNWANQFWTEAQDFACYPNDCQNGASFVRRLALQKKKEKQKLEAHVSMLLKWRSSIGMLFSASVTRKELLFDT